MAVSTARKIAAVLFAVAMVGSVAVGPALADDDDVSVGDDGVNVGGDDGATVSVGDDDDANGSATVDADVDSDGADGSVEVSGGDGDGTSGSVDCDLSSADCETSSGDDDGGSVPEAPDGEAPDVDGLFEEDLPDAEAPGGGSGSSVPTGPITTPELLVDAPDLPVSYTSDGIEAQGETVVPFAALPDFCNPPYGVDDVQESNPVDPTDPFGGTRVKEQLPGEIQEPPGTPVGNPLSLVGAPIGQCEVFNPYDPAVNPTSPPDDPSATINPATTNIGEDRAISYLTIDTTTDKQESDSPGSETMTLIVASEGFTAVVVDSDATDSQSDFGGELDARLYDNQPNKGSYTVTAQAFSRSAGLSINCDGSECKPRASGVPSGDAVPAFPAGGGGDDDGESPEPDPSVDTDRPTTVVNEDRVLLYDNRETSLGDGLPRGENMILIVRSGDFVAVRQDTDGSQNENRINAESEYTSGENPGDDDARVVAKANGAGVVAGFECDDYRCTPTQGTGVYAGPAGMLFEMLPDNPIEE